MRIQQHLAMNGTERSKLVVCVFHPGLERLRTQDIALQILKPFVDLTHLQDVDLDGKLRAVAGGKRYVLLDEYGEIETLFERHTVLIDEIINRKGSGQLGIVTTGLDIPAEFLDRAKVICLGWPEIGFVFDGIRRSFDKEIPVNRIEWLYPTLAKLPPKGFVRLVDSCHGDAVKFEEEVTGIPPRLGPGCLPPMALQIWETWIPEWQIGEFKILSDQKPGMLVKALVPELQLKLRRVTDNRDDITTLALLGQPDKVDFQVDVLAEILGASQGLLIILDFAQLPRRRWFEFAKKIRNIKPAVVLVKGISEYVVALGLCHILKAQTNVQAFIFEGRTQQEFADWQIPKIQV